MPEPIVLYIGTYTSPTGSKGIYRVSLDPVSGTLSEPALAAEGHNPSYLAVGPGGRSLYAVHEFTNGEVSAFAVGGDGTLSPLNTQPSGGAGPCHLSVDLDGRQVFVANYNNGVVACLPAATNGSLGPPTCVIHRTGSGPNKARQEGPHMHWIVPDSQGRFVYACDLGTDEVLIYRPSRSDGKLAPGSPSDFKFPPGSGPRHGAFHPRKPFLFVNCELANTVTSFSVDVASGALTGINTLSTLPTDTSTPNTTAEIVCHPSGRWVYVSNRGHDSVACYEVGDSGSLRLLVVKPLGLREPRGFAIDPSGKWLVASGQNSNDLAAFPVDGTTGLFGDSVSKVSIGSPVCVTFLDG